MQSTPASAPLMRSSAPYLLWIALCAVLFGAFWGAEDPSRRAGRILTDEAAARAAAIVRHDPRYRAYEVVHTAWANRGEGGSEARWVVLLDTVPHSALHDAVVVEIRASDGGLLEIRRPE